ncbi:hypothetical protein [Bremerella sp.]
MPHSKALCGYECGRSRHGVCVATFHIINQRLKFLLRQRSNP